MYGALVDSSPTNEVDMAGHVSHKKELEQRRADLTSGLG